MMTFDEFIALSAVLTGYPASTLLPARDTQKVAAALYAELGLPGNNIPAARLAELTQVWNSISGTPPPQLQAAVQAKIIENANISRLAQNIIYLWYFGIWYDLTKNPNSFATPNIDHVVSPLAYTNGLVWGEMGAHPMGFSVGEFGYWANVPTLPVIG
ncbi:MAG TPA: hypothetical protein VFE53_05220 [Mucilaginibacter sp.]|nr:hypothetical protein [Mucilaginibacter sp.]